MTDHHRSRSFFSHLPYVQLHSDDEHEKHDADLAELSQRFHRRRGEQKCHRLRIDQSQHGRTHHDPRNHLTHDRWLTKPAEQPAKQAGHREDDDDLRE